MVDTVTKAELRSAESGPVLSGNAGDLLGFGPDGRTVQGFPAPTGRGVPLANTLWVDKAATTAGPGLSFKAGAQGAFPSLAAALAAATLGLPLRLFVVAGDYTAEGPQNFAGFPNVSIFGVGLRPDFIALPDLLGAGNLTIRDVLTGNVDGNVDAGNCLVGGKTSLGGGGKFFNSTIQGNYESSAQPILLMSSFNPAIVCDIDGATVDEFTLQQLGILGVLTTVLEPALALNFRQQVAWLVDRDRTLNAAPGNWTTSRAICPAGTLTAPRAVTVDLTTVPALGTFTVDCYDTTGNALTVNGANVAGTSPQRTVFQVQAGPVLTPLFQESL